MTKPEICLHCSFVVYSGPEEGYREFLRAVGVRLSPEEEPAAGLSKREKRAEELKRLSDKAVLLDLPSYDCMLCMRVRNSVVLRKVHGVYIL